MIAIMLPSVYTIEIGDTPILVFEAQNLREAHELCHEQWLRGDLTEARSEGVPLWDGKAKLRARVAAPGEIALFAEAKNITAARPTVSRWSTWSKSIAKPRMTRRSIPANFRLRETDLPLCWRRKRTPIKAPTSRRAWR